MHICNIAKLKQHVNPIKRVDMHSGFCYIIVMVQIHNGKITNIKVNLKNAIKVVGEVASLHKDKIILRFTVPNPDFECKSGFWTNIGPTTYETVYLELNDTIIINGNRFDCSEISDYEATRLVKNITTLIDLEKLA